jgi:hypothetical protein
VAELAEEGFAAEEPEVALAAPRPAARERVLAQPQFVAARFEEWKGSERARFSAAALPAAELRRCRQVASVRWEPAQRLARSAEQWSDLA